MNISGVRSKSSSRVLNGVGDPLGICLPYNRYLRPGYAMHGQGMDLELYCMDGTVLPVQTKVGLA